MTERKRKEKKGRKKIRKKEKNKPRIIGRRRSKRSGRMTKM